MSTPLKYYTTPEGPLLAVNEDDSQVLKLPTAVTAVAHTFNEDVNLMRIQADQDVYYLTGANPTAVAPSASVTDGSASILLAAGEVRWVNMRGKTKVSCVSAVNDTYVNILEWN